MATNTQFLPYAYYTLAEFKLWGQATGIALAAFGWTQDTLTQGQVNWSTLTNWPGQDPVALAAVGVTNFRGAYSTAGVTYQAGDVVTFNGATWYCIANTPATSATTTTVPGQDLLGGTQHWRLWCFEVWKSAVTPTMYLRFEYIGNSAIPVTAAQIRIFTSTERVDVLTLVSVANASAGTTVYTGTITGGGTNNFTGKTFIIAGFTNGANNGTFVCTANTTTTLTLNNASGVAETAAATASSYSGNMPGSGVTGQQAMGPFNLVPSNVGVANQSYGNLYPCYFSGDNGNRFAMLMWNDQASGLGAGFFCVERSLTNTGSYYTTPAGIFLVQAVSDTYRNVGAGPITKAFTSNNTAGNLILVLASNVGSSTSGVTISDTNLNTYHPLFTPNTGVNTFAQAGWYAENIASGPNTVSVAWTTAPNTSAALALVEYGGFSTSTLDQNPALATGNSTTPTTNSATTTQNEELLIAMIVANGGSLTSTAPFTARATETSGTVFAHIADQRVDATGTFTAAGSASTGNWLAQISTFKAASNRAPITPYWTVCMAGYSNTWISQAVVNTGLSIWVKTGQDSVPWVLGAQGTHLTTTIESATVADTEYVNMSLPVLPVFPLVGWVGNPLTAIMGFKVSDAPRDGTFTVQVYGTTHTYFASRNSSWINFGGTNNNSLAMRFD